MNETVKMKQKELIEAIVTSRTITEALDRTNIPPRTYQNWRKKDSFKKELIRREEEIYAASAKRLISLREKALDTLEEVMNDPAKPGAGMKLRVAQIILDQSKIYHDRIVADREKNMTVADKICRDLEIDSEE
jgi:hypothetical protein